MRKKQQSIQASQPKDLPAPKIMKIGESCKCGNELDAVPVENNGIVAERTRFAFDITHRRDGTPIKDLEKKGAVLGILELGWCDRCEDYATVIDATDDKELWSSLPRWQKSV